VRPLVKGPRGAQEWGPRGTELVGACCVAKNDESGSIMESRIMVGMALLTATATTDVVATQQEPSMSGDGACA
jgi:hypothetical protein